MGGGDNPASTEAVSQTDVGDAVTINIRCSTGSKFSVQTNLDSTVVSFKELLARNCNIPADQQRLIYKGRILKDDQTLHSYGLEADHTVHLVRGFAPPPPPTTTNAAGSISSGASETTQTNTRAVGSDDAGALGAGGAGLGASLFPGIGLGGLGGSAGLFGAGLPDFEQVQQQLTQNPNIMREIMNMPAVQNIMNNPEIMRNLIMNNPQMQEIIDRNPELAHILNDPSTLRQTLETARNPELMREMMRNTDRAMSNIESSPEGFNMLRRMYETVQEPFLNATTMAGSIGNDSSNPFAALLGTQGGNQARDGSTNQSTTASGTTPNPPAPNTNPLPNPWSSAASLEADHTVHLVRGFAPPPPPTTTNAAGSISSGASETTQTNTRAVGSDDAGALGAGGAGLGASLFPGIGLGGLGGSAGLFGAGLPDFEQVQQQLTQNPNIMREIMNMPAVQNIMNNPEIMRNLIMNNPQMQEIIDRNPELAHILNDPSTLRQTLETARNPELMREMMRNTDRAMSNIESSPEGFNMLRRMYETVQEPFLNATTMAGSIGNDSSNPFAALLGTQGGNQARDGSTNQSTTASGTTPNPPAPNTNPLPNPWSSAATGGAQTNTTRSNPSANARPQAPAGLGGLGLPEFEGMFGAMQDTNSLNQLMQNPAISQMMQSLLSNPQYMNQVLGLNPQLQSMLDSNSQLREMMRTPEFLRQLTSPETMQQLLTLQQSLLSQLSRPQSTQESAQTGGGAGTRNMGLEALMTMFGGLGAGSLAVPNRSDVPPEQLYATQLSQLQEMGFIDTQENIRALIASAGNVHAAVERLLGNHPGQ